MNSRLRPRHRMERKRSDTERPERRPPGNPFATALGLAAFAATLIPIIPIVHEGHDTAGLVRDIVRIMLLVFTIVFAAVLLASSLPQWIRRRRNARTGESGPADVGPSRAAGSVKSITTIGMVIAVCAVTFGFPWDMQRQERPRTSAPREATPTTRTMPTISEVRRPVSGSTSCRVVVEFGDLAEEKPAFAAPYEIVIENRTYPVLGETRAIVDPRHGRCLEMDVALPVRSALALDVCGTFAVRLLRGDAVVDHVDFCVPFDLELDVSPGGALIDQDDYWTKSGSLLVARLLERQGFAAVATRALFPPVRSARIRGRMRIGARAPARLDVDSDAWKNEAAEIAVGGTISGVIADGFRDAFSLKGRDDIASPSRTDPKAEVSIRHLERSIRPGEPFEFVLQVDDVEGGVAVALWIDGDLVHSRTLKASTCPIRQPWRLVVRCWHGELAIESLSVALGPR